MSKADEKWDYNYNQLRSSYSSYFIHVPVQYGNLSDEKRRVLKRGYAVIKDKHGVKSRAVLLQIKKGFTSEGKKLIWCEEREDEPREDGEFWWSYGFEDYSKSKWKAYQDEMEKNKQEMGNAWYGAGRLINH